LVMTQWLVCWTRFLRLCQRRVDCHMDWCDECELVVFSNFRDKLMWEPWELVRTSCRLKLAAIGPSHLWKSKATDYWPV
jgi:hypothetical protein